MQRHPIGCLERPGDRMSATSLNEVPYEVIARRFRPQRFDDVLGQDAVVATLKNAIKHERLAQAYLFCGTRGTGKTTLARLLAKAINCKERGAHLDPCGKCASCREIAVGISFDVLEIDGASNRGIDDIRALTENAPYASAAGGTKITIIDEVHMLTKEAFNALLKTLEEPPPNFRFIFATTEPHKVPATILSRCQRFDLARIPRTLLVTKLKSIAKSLHRRLSDEALYLIAQQAEGSFRDSESLLDQVLAYQPEGDIQAQSTAIALGILPQEMWFRLDELVAQQALAAAIDLAQEILGSGIDVLPALEQLLLHLRCHLLVQLESIPEDLPAEWAERYQAHRNIYSAKQLLALVDTLTDLWLQSRQVVPSAWILEHALLKVVRSATTLSLEQITGQLLHLEQRLLSGHTSLQSAEAVLPVSEKKKLISPPVAPVSPKKPTVSQALTELKPAVSSVRIDNLMRFAAVELEGALKQK